MKITVEFDSFKELDDFTNGVAVAPKLLGSATVETPVEEPKKTTKKAKKVEEPKVDAPEEETPVEEAPKTDDGLMSDEEFKKILADKIKTDRPRVKEFMASYGANSLSELIAKKNELDWAAVIAAAEEL